MNLDFLLSFTVEVERLFSVSGRILVDNRQQMIPILSESLVFLKINRKYRDFQTVRRSLVMASRTEATTRIDEDEEDQTLSGL